MFSFITTDTRATCIVISDALRASRIRYGRITSSASAPGATNEIVPDWIEATTFDAPFAWSSWTTCAMRSLFCGSITE